MHLSINGGCTFVNDNTSRQALWFLLLEYNSNRNPCHSLTWHGCGCAQCLSQTWDWRHSDDSSWGQQHCEKALEVLQTSVSPEGIEGDREGRRMEGSKKGERERVGMGDEQGRQILPDTHTDFPLCTYPLWLWFFSQRALLSVLG